MRPTENVDVDADVASGDGSGEISSVFEQMSDAEISRVDEYRRLADEFVLAPLRIIVRDWRALVGMTIVASYLLMGTVGVYVVGEPVMNEGPIYLQPFEDWSHPLGTDSTGTDIFKQIVHATPPILKMITAGAVFSTVVATVVGTASGYKGGRFDRIAMSITDVMMTIPGLPLVIVIAAVVEPRNPWVVGIVLTVNAWSGLARSLRSQVLTLREMEYVEASRTMGIGTPTILARDIVPNLMPYISVNFVNAARGVIFSAVGLYFLGILPFTSTGNWGVMMNMAYTTGGALYTTSTAHWLFVPMFVVVFLSLGLILFAQGLDRIFNPRVRARHAKTVEDDGEEGESPPQQVSPGHVQT